MSKKETELSRNQASVLYTIVAEGPAWASPVAQYRQMKLIEQMQAWPAEAETVTLTTTSPDRALLIAALEAPQAAAMIRGKGVAVLWALKEALGWKRPDDVDMEEDAE
jgi:hypothetical protein